MAFAAGAYWASERSIPPEPITKQAIAKQARKHPRPDCQLVINDRASAGASRP